MNYTKYFVKLLIAGKLNELRSVNQPEQSTILPFDKFKESYCELYPEIDFKFEEISFMKLMNRISCDIKQHPTNIEMLLRFRKIIYIKLIKVFYTEDQIVSMETINEYYPSIYEDIFMKG